MPGVCAIFCWPFCGPSRLVLSNFKPIPSFQVVKLTVSVYAVLGCCCTRCATVFFQKSRILRYSSIFYWCRIKNWFLPTLRYFYKDDWWDSHRHRAGEGPEKNITGNNLEETRFCLQFLFWGVSPRNLHPLVSPRNLHPLMLAKSPRRSLCK